MRLTASDEVVADVGERVVGLARPMPSTRSIASAAAVEHVALRDDQLEEPEQAAAHHHDPPAVGVRRVLEGALLEARDLGLDVTQEREDALRERVEDAVDDLLVGVHVLRAHRLERLARAAVHGDDARLRRDGCGPRRSAMPSRVARRRRRSAGGRRSRRSSRAGRTPGCPRPPAAAGRGARRARSSSVVGRRVEVEPEELAAVASARIRSASKWSRTCIRRRDGSRGAGWRDRGRVYGWTTSGPLAGGHGDRGVGRDLLGRPPPRAPACRRSASR